MVVTSPIATAIENKVISITPAANPIEAITSSTIPLPFIRNPIARLTSRLNPTIFAPMYPAAILVTIATPSSAEKRGIALTRD
jgi:hypothetical protein